MLQRTTDWLFYVGSRRGEFHSPAISDKIIFFDNYIPFDFFFFSAHNRSKGFNPVYQNPLYAVKGDIYEQEEVNSAWF